MYFARHRGLSKTFPVCPAKSDSDIPSINNQYIGNNRSFGVWPKHNS
jgi:hypothetical protein